MAVVCKELLSKRLEREQKAIPVRSLGTNILRDDIQILPLSYDSPVLPHFYYHPRMLAYEISPKHPLKPKRLRRAIELLTRLGVVTIDPGLASDADVLRVHSLEYLEAVKVLDPPRGPAEEEHGQGHAFLISDDILEMQAEYGFMAGDNPAFPNMYSASLAYLGGSVRAAEAVRDGAPLAFGIAGGLHHALRSKASGFCVFNDPAVACHVLREKFDRVAYVDIDVHHGDGVQWIFYVDPTVMTCSIHEEGKTLWPGTGWVEETGAEFSSVNVPMQARTTGDVWLDAFERGILPALERFQPQAIVLQMGTDTHFLDPLAHLNNSAQEWLQAVVRIRDLGIPLVALGGGGYNLTTVPRMWTAACLTLGNLEVPELVPADLAEAWEMPRFFDAELPGPRGSGREYAEGVLARLAALR